MIMRSPTVVSRYFLVEVGTEVDLLSMLRHIFWTASAVSPEYAQIGTSTNVTTCGLQLVSVVLRVPEILPRPLHS